MTVQISHKDHQKYIYLSLLFVSLLALWYANRDTRKPVNSSQTTARSKATTIALSCIPNTRFSVRLFH